MRIVGDGWWIDVHREFLFYDENEEPVHGLTEIRGEVRKAAGQFDSVAATMDGGPASVEFAGRVFLGVRAVGLSEDRCEFVASGVEDRTPEQFFAEEAAL